MAHIDPRHAIVTPTYLPDLARCELLVESLDRIGGRHRHYLIIDRRDVPAFRHLESERTRIIESEGLLGRRFFRLPGFKYLWFTLRTPPVRGWILQQIRKIACFDQIEEDVAILCDSDVTFIRDFDHEDLLTDGKLPLLDVSSVSEEVRGWTKVACEMLGINAEAVEARNHVGHMVVWSRQAVYALRERIEATSNLPWQIAIARQLRFSEYILYGVFVREVAGLTASNHVRSTEPLVKGCWGMDPADEGALEAFVSNLDPRTVALMVHSKDGVDVDRIRQHVARFWTSDA